MSIFPSDFLWGAACASYQCEGAWNEAGKGPSIWDDFTHDVGKSHVRNDENGDIACDSYHRFEADIALMKQFHLQAYRFSINWPRIFPDGSGTVNEAGLAYYDRLVDALLKNGIEPWITLYHWETPSALEARGGWVNRETVDAFEAFSAVIAKRFNGRVKHYITLNEPQCTVGLGYGNGEHAPGKRLSDEEQIRCMHNLTLAHSAAYRAIKRFSPEAEAGVSLCGRLCYPVIDTQKNREAAYRVSFDLGKEEYKWSFTFNIFMDSLMFRRFDESAPDKIKLFADTVSAEDWASMEPPDFLGVNVYQGTCVDEQGNQTGGYSGAPLTANRWFITPEVMRYGMNNLYRRYGLPIYITENGQACNDRIFLDGKVHDADRIDFMHRYLCELGKAIDDGTPVKGYLHWSFLDNFEWAEGYNDRFGLVYVDYRTLDRIPKDSIAWYADVIRTNGSKI